MSVAITVTILTKNSEAFLSKVLKSTEIFDEVIIFDTGSIDSTLEIAARFKNVKIIKAEFEGFGKTHNLASSLATHDWILSVDSDEILSPKLVKEISCLNLQRGTVYSVSRKNIFKVSL